MDRVKSFDLFGTDVRQIPCITGKGAPTKETEGAAGEMYMDTDTGKVYKCVSIINGEYVWEETGSIHSQGRSAKYSFSTPGWKRVLQIIRVSGGMVNFGISQTTPLYMAQAAGIVFSGFVKYGEDTSANAKPVLYQMYNNIFGEDDAMQNPARITKVRIGYPDPNQDNYDNGTKDAIRNPVNCYLDVYVDYDKDALNSGKVGFNMNYSGFAESHKCEAIIQETDAVDTGTFGEKLLYYELELNENSGMYMPYNAIDAKILRTHGEDVWSGKEVADRMCEIRELYDGSENLVTIDPIYGYPLEVETYLNAKSRKSISIVHAGKNLLGMENTDIPFGSKTKNGVTFTRNTDGTISVVGTSTVTESSVLAVGDVLLPAGTYTYSFGYYDSTTQVRGQLYSVEFDDGGKEKLTSIMDGVQLGFSDIKKTFTLTKPTILRSRIRYAQTCNAMVKPQIEVGEEYSAYEQYCGVRHTVDFGEEYPKCQTFRWDKGELEYVNAEGDVQAQFTPHRFPAFPGFNNIYTEEEGDTIYYMKYGVSLVDKIYRLERAIKALGGTI